MPGQCYKCGTEFGVFKKERGCKNCGYAFCNKCLNEKPVPVPKRNNDKHHVCHDCHKILTGLVPASTKPVTYDLPEAYLKRVAALEQRNSQPQAGVPSSKSQNATKIPESLLKLDKADREIAMRLEKLKERDKPKEPITDAHLHARLAELKGQTVQSASKPVYVPPKRIPETQQVDDLLKQLSEEVAIDSRLPDPAQEIEERLQRYRESDGQKTSKPGIDDNNLDLREKGENNLNVIDKVGPVTKPYGLNISGASNLEDQDLDTIHQIIAHAAKEVETDAQKALENLHKDKELMDRLRILQAERDKNKQSEDASSVNSDTDNTTKGSDVARSLSAQVPDSDEEIDDDAAAAQLVQRYIQETKIDDSVGDSVKLPPGKSKPSSSKKGTNKKSGKSVEHKDLNLDTKSDTSDSATSNSDYDDSDELPYCCLCTEDASIRCRDCDLDLYCQKCFVECHQKMDITDHRTVAYKAPKGYR